MTESYATISTTRDVTPFKSANENAELLKQRTNAVLDEVLANTNNQQFSVTITAEDNEVLRVTQITAGHQTDFSCTNVTINSDELTNSNTYVQLTSHLNNVSELLETLLENDAKEEQSDAE